MEVRTHTGGGLDYLVVEPDGFDDGREYPAVFLLHGYGSNMRDLAGLSPIISRDSYLYVCPNAPVWMDRPGMRGFAWWESESDDHGPALEFLSAVVERTHEQYRVLPGRSVLGGFSQGAMLTYEFGLPRPDIFAGLIALSGHIVDEGRLRSSLPRGRGQSIFISHGTEDTIIPVERGRASRDIMLAEGYAPDYHEYRMDHRVSQEVLDDLVPWIRRATLSGARE